MRVKWGLDIGRSGTPMRDSRAEIDTERLTKELAEHREADKRILGLLESQSCDESQLVTCGSLSSVSVSHFSIILIPVSKFGIPTLATNVTFSSGYP
jgi:hypothetical protein